MLAPTRPRQKYSPVRQHHANLPADPRAAAEARGLVRAAVRRWSVPVDIDIASILTSELVTNAVTHGNAAAAGDADGGESEGDSGEDPASGPFVTLTITEGLDCLRVEVRDTSRAQPVVKSPKADAEHGRGLFLVDTLAETWGCDRLPSGKAVYFVLRFG
jgi:anti-sigma regulatory factor (Ser/Thr protein kinase)